MTSSHTANYVIQTFLINKIHCMLLYMLHCKYKMKHVQIKHTNNNTAIAKHAPEALGPPIKRMFPETAVWPSGAEQ